MDNLSVTDWCHHFLSLQISPGDLCIDATTGNGHDTAFLASLVGADGQVIGFDIQQSALDAAGKLLRAQGLIDRVRLVLDSHEHIDQYAIPGTVSCITFNLGYLPGGGHAIATKAATTLPAIAAGLPLLKKGGLMTICVYQGGDTGFEEHDAVLRYLSTLDPKTYLVIASSYLNRPNHPPKPVLVIRLK